MLKKLLQHISIPSPGHEKPKLRKRIALRRYLAAMLCGCMMVPTIGSIAMATEETAYVSGPCEHHTAHDADCGYVEAVEGAECQHIHDENCGYVEAKDEVPCYCPWDEAAGMVVHAEGCGYQAPVEGQPCNHVHDADCGYTEAVEGQPCGYVCEICSGEEIGSEPTPLSDAVGAQPDALADNADNADDTDNNAADDDNAAAVLEENPLSAPELTTVPQEDATDCVITVPALKLVVGKSYTLAQLLEGATAQIADTSTEADETAQEQPSLAVGIQSIVKTANEVSETLDITSESFELTVQSGESYAITYFAYNVVDLEKTSLGTEEVIVAPIEPKGKVTIGEQTYKNLTFAVAAAKPGDTIDVWEDIAESVRIPKTVTIDLNGNTWTGRNGITLLADMSISSAVDSIVTVQNGNMTSVSGYRAIETKLVNRPEANSPTANIVVSNVHFTTNGSYDSIYVQNGDLTATNCTFTGKASQSGGYGSHITIKPVDWDAHPNVKLTISGCTFTGANSLSGAVYAAVDGKQKGRGVVASISNSTFNNNTVGFKCNVDNSASIPKFDIALNGCTFTDHTGMSVAISNNNKNTANFKLDIKNTDFTNNSNSVVNALYSNVSITGGNISGNKINESNHIVQVYGDLNINGTTVSDNTASRIISVEKANTVSIHNANISNNTATQSADFSGGGLVRIDKAASSVSVISSTFNGNTAKASGGALNVSGNAAIPFTIDSCTFTNNTCGDIAGAIYVNNTGTTTIANTTITENTANKTVSKAAAYGYVGGGLYVKNTTGTVTLSGSTHIYNNHTPNDTKLPGTNDGGSADICLASTTTTSSSTAKNPDNFARANLVLDIDPSFSNPKTGDVFTLTQFDRKLLSTNGWYNYSGSSYSWPMGYYTSTAEAAKVYLVQPSTTEHVNSDACVVQNIIAEAVAAAQTNGLDKIYVCGNFTVTNADEAALNSGITFARCPDHPNGHMFTISGEVNLQGAHIDGLNVPGNNAMIRVPSGSHLIIQDGTIIENGNNSTKKKPQVKSDGGGAIGVYGSLTMYGGEIRNNHTEGDGNMTNGGGGIYAYHASSLEFEGGKVYKNTAGGWSGGGGAYIESSPTKFGVNSGRTVFDSNTARIGGGVCLNNGDSYYIYKASFTNNTATRPIIGEYFCGGGIYINSGTTVYMKNVFVSENKSGTSEPNSALGICPTGETKVLDQVNSDGILVVNNKNQADIGSSMAN